MWYSELCTAREIDLRPDEHGVVCIPCELTQFDSIAITTWWLLQTASYIDLRCRFAISLSRKCEIFKSTPAGLYVSTLPSNRVSLHSSPGPPASPHLGPSPHHRNYGTSISTPARATCLTTWSSRTLFLSFLLRPYYLSLSPTPSRLVQIASAVSL